MTQLTQRKYYLGLRSYIRKNLHSHTSSIVPSSVLRLSLHNLARTSRQARISSASTTSSEYWNNSASNCFIRLAARFLWANSASCNVKSDESCMNESWRSFTDTLLVLDSNTAGPLTCREKERKSSCSGPRSHVTLLHGYSECQDDTANYLALDCSRARSTVVLPDYLWKSSQSINSVKACSDPQTVLHVLYRGCSFSFSMHHVRMEDRTEYQVPESLALGFPHTAQVGPFPIYSSPSSELTMGVTKKLISFKCIDENVIFIMHIRQRLANRVSVSSVCNELITVTRILYGNHELRLDPENNQVLLCKPSQLEGQASFNFS